jgi:hypothetical protein
MSDVFISYAPRDLADWAQTWVRNEALHALILKGLALAGERAQRPCR